MRQARYDLAQALLAEGDVRITEAVEQFDLAVNETGDEPENWELLSLGAQAIRDATPADAVARYLRSLRQQAPDRTAHETREWVERLRPGTLQLSPAATDSLLKEPTTPARQLLAATLLRSIGDSERAHAVIGTVRPSSDIREPLATLDIQCLIDLGDFHGAESALDDPAHSSVLSARNRILLRARLAFTRRDFIGALDVLQQLEGPQTDEIDGLRNLAYVGAGRASEVRWLTPEPDDATGPDTWLSRAVAALASNRYDDAQAAASWAERLLPESLSVLLLKAQAHLEKDELEPGLAMLSLVAKSSQERGSEPLWLEQQRVVRVADRFAYVECEYERLNGVSDVDRIRAVDMAKTTYFQDGRLAEFEAEAYGSGPDWAAAMDRSVSAYKTADANAAALPLAEQVFRAEPTPARALAFGWAAYGASIPDDPIASNVDPAVQVPHLIEAISALEGILPRITDDDLQESLRLLTALNARHVELLDRDAIAAGAKASPWAFAGAIVATDNVWQQVMVEWFVRTSFDIATASFEIAEYAGTLDPSHQMTRETRLIAHTNLLGVNKKIYDLLEEFKQQAGADSTDTSTAQWCHGVELRLAILDGDLRRARELFEADMGEFPWVLRMRAWAKIQLDGVDAAELELARSREILRRTPSASPLTQALLAALSGDHDEADAFVTVARDNGNDLAADIRDTTLLLQCARRRDRPLHEFADDLIRESRTKAALLWLERSQLPALMALRGDSPAEEQSEISERLAHRRAELETNQGDWVQELARTDATLGALAVLWRAAAQHNPSETASALRQMESMEWPDTLHSILSGVKRSARARLADDVLIETAAALAGGNEPDRDLVERELADVRTPSATVARALAGAGRLDDPPAEEELAAGVSAFAETTRRCANDADAVWRLYDAVGTLQGKSAHVWQPVLRDRLLALLGPMVGLDSQPDYNYRSYLSFVLGEDFIPEDTSERWVLLSEYIPALRDRILAATGYRIPGFNVRAGQSGPSNVVYFLLHDVIFEKHQLPSDGVIVRLQQDALPSETGQVRLTDPLTGAPVQNIAPGAPEPAGVMERWLPLQFVMRHVERFVHNRLADIVTIADAVNLAERAGSEVVQQLSDPAFLLRWLAETRREIANGSAPEDDEAMIGAIAERVRQVATMADPPPGAAASEQPARVRSIS